MKKHILIPFIILTALLLQSCSYTPYGFLKREKKNNELPALASPDPLQGAIPSAKPQSVIFIIADGAGIGQFTLAYYTLPFFAPARFDHVGLSTTHPQDGAGKVTDSAASGTALATGQKTYNSAISVDAQQQPLKTIAEWAIESGKATGLVATATISHATPAVFAAHVPHRYDEPEIARQMAHSQVQVLFGGGGQFWPDSLRQQLQKQQVQVLTDLNSPIDYDRRVVGLFAEGALPPAHENRQPSTVAMTRRAIEILEKDEDGFFLMVEESQIDWAGHANSATFMSAEMASLNELVHYCLDYQSEHPEVLVLLTADHETGGTAVADKEPGVLNIEFTSMNHSANMVPVWATGPGADAFDTVLDNTEIGRLLIDFVRP